MSIDYKQLSKSQSEDYRKLLCSLLKFSPYRNWHILVQWLEPDENDNSKTKIAYGPLNDRFFRWLDIHLNRWQDKAYVGMVGISLIAIHTTAHKELKKTW